MGVPRPGYSGSLDIIRELNRAKVKYLVIGGVAVIYHGVPRATFDLDLSVWLAPENLQRLESVMKRIGFVPKAPVPVTGLANPLTRREWTQHKGMKVFAFEELKPPFRLVDIMVASLRNFHQVYKRRVEVHDQGVTIPLMPIPELIRTKTGTGRPKDQEDIENLRFVESVRRPTQRRESA
ncbi:MAG: hypothetical protein HY737_03250 [Candidatus Omnitrophica bacterium]|nr:hypothetical protein [Candidatus Omnitrophota bacterium]